MILGFDIDDVIFKTSEIVKNNIDKSQDEELLKHKLDIMRGDAVNEKVGKFLKDNVIPTIKATKPMENVSEVIKDFRKQGDTIILITARGDGGFPGSEEISEKRLEKYGIEYDSIIYDCKDKAKACKEHDVEFFIDDSPKHCLEVSQKLGISVIGFESDINKEEMEKNHIKCVNSWNEIAEIVKNVKNG